MNCDYCNLVEECSNTHYDICLQAFRNIKDILTAKKLINNKCPHCNNSIPFEGFPNCPYCGQKLQWE